MNSVIVSADSHVLEPFDLWERTLGAKYGDRVPRLVKRFEGRDGKVERLVAARVEWQKDVTGATKMMEVPGSEFAINADLVLLAMGFVGPVQKGLLEQFGVERDARSNVKADTEDYRTSVPKVFAAGDMRRGQSLVVWAIREGRQAARSVDAFLMGTTALPR